MTRSGPHATIMCVWTRTHDTPPRRACRSATSLWERAPFGFRSAPRFSVYTVRLRIFHGLCGLASIELRGVFSGNEQRSSIGPTPAGVLDINYTVSNSVCYSSARRGLGRVKNMTALSEQLGRFRLTLRLVQGQVPHGFLGGAAQLGHQCVALALEAGD